ncbi:MAG TPA: type 2 lanthipeptide synthetase LanM [Candidatus Angelobacter sp.]
MAAALAEPFVYSCKAGGALGGYNEAEQLPFQEVLVGFLIYARRMLEAKAQNAIAILQPSAIAALERELLSHLSFLASLTLGHAFYDFRFRRAPLSAFESLWVEQKPSREIYEAFVRHMRRSGLRKLLYRYPVLGRLLAQSVEFWVQSTTNLCKRFLSDFSSLKSFWGWKVECPQQSLVGVKLGLSDRHNRGETVSECVLQTGERVIYKPRTVSGEAAFSNFVQWLNAQGLSLKLSSLRALDRISYGWVGYVQAKPCSCDSEVERFYSRAGMLLAAIHVLGVTDIHCENLIASGEFPVIVDLETLLNERVVHGQVRPPSVITTGMLPQLPKLPDRREPDASALGADIRRDSGIRFPVWTSINTDQMMLSEGASLESEIHRVQIGKRLPSVMEYLQSFQNGFREAYLCILKNRSSLLSRASLMQEFENLELRVMVRDSETYARIQMHLLRPEFLEDGVDRSIEIEWLARPLCASGIPLKGRAGIYAHECTAMERLDIPHFTTSAWRRIGHAPDSEDLLAFGGRRDSSVLRRRLLTLSPSDCKKQLKLIGQSLTRRFTEDVAIRHSPRSKLL